MVVNVAHIYIAAQKCKPFLFLLQYHDLLLQFLEGKSIYDKAAIIGLNFQLISQLLTDLGLNSFEENRLLVEFHQDFYFETCQDIAYRFDFAGVFEEPFDYILYMSFNEMLYFVTVSDFIS